MAAFAKYEGIDGESKDVNHQNWIDVLSIDWGVHKPGGGATGPTRRRGDTIVEDLNLTIEYEKASPKLLEKCAKGAVIPKLEIELTTTYGGARVTYLKYELENVIVSSYKMSASGNDEAGPPTVVISNNFKEIKVTYSEFDDEGSNQGNTETSFKVGKGKAR